MHCLQPNFVKTSLVIFGHLFNELGRNWLIICSTMSVLRCSCIVLQSRIFHCAAIALRASGAFFPLPLKMCNSAELMGRKLVCTKRYFILTTNRGRLVRTCANELG